MKLTPLISDDYARLKPYFREQTYRLCSYSLSSAIAWSNQQYRPYKAIVGESVIIACEFTKETQNRHLLLPVSPKNAFSPEELRDLALQLGFSGFWFVPEDYIQTHGREQISKIFRISRQKGFDDYVYLTQDLIDLPGNKYSKKRNLINQFERHCLSERKVVVEPMTRASLDECLDFMDKWCEERDCGEQDSSLACERQAVINTIENMDLLEVTGLMLRIDGEVSAFGMASYLTPEVGVLHFEKAFAEIKGLYQYFDRICVEHLLKGYKYTDKENDMGIPGLRKAKKSYHPIMTVRSYRLDLK